MALATFLIVFAVSRIVGLASIISVTSFAIAQLTFMGQDVFVFGQLPLTLFSTMVPALIVWKHRSNIIRMLRGDEQKLNVGSESQDTTPDAVE